jgi:hypothetical protein
VPEAVDFLRVIQQFVAVDAVGITAMRNQGPGVLRAARGFLCNLDLSAVPTSSQQQYQAWLDATTDAILSALPVRNRPWGTARKALNLFMRACVCDYHLRCAYGLDMIEQWAEIPVDGVVACALKKQAGRGVLPRWQGLKHLKKADHQPFQEFAIRYARELGLPAPVYLDNYLWFINR